ncbi:MAG TPA: hypothetical protein VFK47_10260, partial [Ktedonobacteraceae bacterium]|nr:hypothetical protein [Ktedonobacteraceae bacterium]
YFLHEALKHYDGDIDSVKVRVIAAVKGENLPHTFNGIDPEKLFPGWYDQGLLTNTANPDWKPGEPFNPTDVWQPHYREMVRYQIMRSGIRPEQLSEEDMIDPADLEFGHASNHAGAHGKMPDGRDAYLVIPHGYQK